jgi:hypothetical protein
MIKAPISLRDLRRRIYRKAKAEPAWRFWGLYVHVCKLETLREAYRLAKQNDGAPGIDRVTFEAIDAEGLEAWLQQLRAELLGHSYLPMRSRRVEIPKRGGKGVRVLSIPTIRDRVVQGALSRRSCARSCWHRARVREICMLCLTRRELETWPWWNCEPTTQSKESSWKPSTYRARASSRPYL